jgi:hypothetical protein
MWLYSGDLSSDARGALQTLLSLVFQEGCAWEQTQRGLSAFQRFQLHCDTIGAACQRIRSRPPLPLAPLRLLQTSLTAESPAAITTR